MTDPNPYESSKSDSSPQQLNPDSKLVVIAAFDNSPEAHCFRIELENQGIRATVANETSAQTIGASIFGRIGAVAVEVLVLEADAKRAREIKSAYDRGMADAQIGEWVCSCGETVDAGFGQCWSCMQPHPGAE